MPGYAPDSNAPQSPALPQDESGGFVVLNLSGAPCPFSSLATGARSLPLLESLEVCMEELR
jgi:hypothetical protein